MLTRLSLVTFLQLELSNMALVVHAPGLDAVRFVQKKQTWGSKCRLAENGKRLTFVDSGNEGESTDLWTHGF